MTSYTDAELQPDVDDVAQKLVDCGRAVVSLVDGWPEEKILALADRLERNDHCVGFRSEGFDVAAQELRTEVMFRRVAEKARASGLDFYCMLCEGKCEARKHEDRANHAYPPMSTEELRIRGLHRDKLIAELLQAKGIG